MTAPVKKAPLKWASSVAAAVAAVLSAASVQAAETAPVLEEILVFGRGQSRQVAEIAAIDIEKAAPGTSALKVISKLPGVSFQSADAYGAYEWSTRISVRGFNQNQLGFTLDGVPLGDMSYGNHNGLHISRAISSENIGNAVLSQGAGTLETATSSNLGGTLQFFSLDPASEFGVNVEATGGSDDNRRGFARFETGELGSLGTRAYLSYTNQYSHKWKGSGKQKYEQINFKVVQPIGEAKLTGFYNWSDRQENDYQDLSFDIINRLGLSNDNLSRASEWDTIVLLAQVGANRGDTGAPVTNAAAGTVYPAPFGTVDDVYGNASGLREDKLAGATLNLPFGEGASWDTTVYGHENDGRGVWFTPYQPTGFISASALLPTAGTFVDAPDGQGGTIAAGTGAPLSLRTTEYAIDRQGVTSALTWTIGDHTAMGGVWYEDNDFDQARRFYGLELAAPQRNSLKFPKDPFFTQWHYAFNTETTMYFLQDTWAVNDTLKFNFGFKSLEVKNKARAIVDVRFATSLAGSIKAEDNFLPQAGFNWQLSDAHEVFGSYTENMRAFQAAATVGPFATSPTNFATLKASGGLKPESSNTYEVGWRYHAASLQAVAAVYFVDFKDRLLTNTIGAGIVGNPVVLQNVGDVETKGAEIGVNWKVASSWNWYNSVSYNDSEYQDDVIRTQVDANGQPLPPIITPTGGKNVVDVPKYLFASELGYDSGTFFGKIGANYTGKRFFSFTNDLNVVGDGEGKVGSYTVVNLGVGYRFENPGFGKNLTIQGNVTNLFEEDYISTIGSNGFTNFGDNQTFLAGADRQWFVSLSGQF